MIGSTSMSQLVKFVGGLVLVFGSLWYLGVSRQHVHAVTRAFRNQRELFIKDFLEHEIDGRFDGTAIQSLCAAKKWTPGLLMSCDEAAGALAKCGTPICIASVSQSRRGMKVYGSMNDLYNVPEATDALQFSISDTTDDWVNGTVMANPHRWHQKFHDFIDERLPVKGRSTPFRVHLKRTQWTWPTATDKAPVTLAFGRMLRIRSDARRLAGSALFTLGSRFGLNLDPRTRYHPASFVGIHLRTEENIDDKYPDYPTQAANYLHYLSESKTNIAFLATGATEDNITAFVERGQDFDVTVVTKLDILDDEEQKVLEKLSWDQRGLVDYEIMLRASRVASVSASAFAWDLALRRSYAFGKGLTGLDLQYPGRIAWKDDYTVLYGKHDNAAAFASTIWP
ncbi:alternative oxidase [Colletotrichum tofieldiae]|nr:alternative oxidase [Colletotrichum tofieldiae]